MNCAVDNSTNKDEYEYVYCKYCQLEIEYNFELPPVTYSPV